MTKLFLMGGFLGMRITETVRPMLFILCKESVEIVMAMIVRDTLGILGMGFVTMGPDIMEEINLLDTNENGILIVEKKLEPRGLLLKIGNMILEIVYGTSGMELHSEMLRDITEEFVPTTIEKRAFYP